MNRTFHTPDPVGLFVELGSGDIATRAVDTSETIVEITGPRAEEFQVEQSGDRVNVVAPRPRFGGFAFNDSHQVSVTLPRGSSLATKAGAADTTATGSYGVVKLRTGSGDVELEDAEGPVAVDSGSGFVRARQVRGELRVKSGSGDVELGELHGDAGISTGSGDVVIERTYGRAVLKSGSGDQEIRRADGDVTLGTASGEITVGLALGGRVTARNVSGDVRVGVPAGTPVWTDISTVTGRIKSALQTLGAPTDGQGHLEVRATTVSGDVHLDLV